MITLGQAACLVLDLEITEENRRKAKDIIKNSPFGITCFNGKAF
jgi:hypothetical protein